jgi:hypothetical protein
MPSCTCWGSWLIAAGSSVAVAFAAASGEAPEPVNTVVNDSERREVNIAPKIATPKAAPTSRK